MAGATFSLHPVRMSVTRLRACAEVLHARQTNVNTSEANRRNTVKVMLVKAAGSFSDIQRDFFLENLEAESM
jgi:hypothetical protein